MTERMQLLRLFGTIERRDDNERTIEGYCFRNADAGDGWVIPRDLMERMTADYMKFANVREMHQPSAVGKAVDLIWDDAGCLMRAKIIDDQAWAKVTEGVYTGFSIGIKPVKLTRNAGKKTLVDGAWYETSLVDRPADADATFVTLSRMDEATEFEVEIDDPEQFAAAVRGAFADKMAMIEKSTLRYAAMDCLSSLLYDIQGSDSNSKESDVRTACSEFAAYIAPIISRGEFESETLGEMVARAVSEHESDDLTISRAMLEQAKTDMVARDAEITRLSARVAELEALPDPDQARPMLNVAEAIKRMAQKPASDDVDRTALAERRDEIMRTNWSTRPGHEKNAAMLELAEIKRVIA